MDIKAHPEFDQYRRDAALVATCRRAVNAWVKGGDVIEAPGGVSWTAERARTFVEEIGALFRRYNLVLWQSFDYCRRCEGGCCVPGASQVTTFDALALALLAQPFPELAPRAAASQCIYLGVQSCRWPAQWRPIKCWAFYCLGSGNWEIDATDDRYAAITAALETVVAEHLPHYVRRGAADEAPLEEFLADPIYFAEALGAVLFDLLVKPISERYGLDAPMEIDLRANEDHESQDAAPEAALAFIAATVESLWQRPIGGAEQLLDDLERLEWIVLERPPSARRELQALKQRYGVGAEEQTSTGATSRHLGRILQQLLDTFPGSEGA